MKSFFLTAIIFAFCIFSGHSQPWTWDLGSGTGTFSTAGSFSTSFLPAAPVGTTFLALTSGASSSIVLQNPGITTLGTNTEIKANAGNSGSDFTKFGVSQYTGSNDKDFYVDFNFILGDANGTGNVSIASDWCFFYGDGTSFGANLTAYSNTEIFTGLKWHLNTDGTITTSYLNNTTWTSFTGFTFSQNTKYYIEIIGSNVNGISYTRLATTYSVPNGFYHIWVNGSLVTGVAGLAKGAFPNGSPIRSFMFYGTTSNTGYIFVDDFLFSNKATAGTITDFYSKSTGTLDVLSNWGSNTDGTGTAPTNFTNTGQTFNIRNNATPTLGANWVVSGANSKVILGNGTNACNFTIPAAYSFTGLIDVNNNGTLTIQNTTIPTLGTLATGSTIDYAASGAQTVSSIPTYSTLKISGSDTKTAEGNLAIAANLNVSAATLDLSTFTANRSTSGGTLTVANGATLKIGGTNALPSNYTAHSIGSTSTIEYSGTTQTVSTLNSSQNYGTLVISGSGTKTLAGSVGVVSDLTINGGTFDLSSNTANRTGTGGTLTLASGATLKIGGTNTFPSNYSTHTLGATSTVNYYGSSQTVSGETYGDLTINVSGTATLGGTATVSASGNLTINTGTFDLGSNTVNRASSGGTLTLANGATLKIGGTNTFPSSYTTNTLGCTSTAEYNGTAQTVAAVSYGNLILSGSGTKTMPGSALTICTDFTLSGTASATAGNTIAVGRNVTLGSGTTFNGSTYTHSVAGNWTNNGCTFSQSGAGTISLTGSAPTIGGTTLTTFNNLTLNNATGATMTQSETINGTLTLTSGTLTVGAYTLTIAGSSPSRTDGTINASNASATLAFTNTSAITLPASIFSDAVNNFSILTAGTGGVTASSDFTINGVLFLQAVNASTTKGSLDMASSSILTMGSSATTTGTGDVSGKVRRNSPASNTTYTFGNTYTNITIIPGASYSAPSSITVNIILGTTAWTGSISRNYEIVIPDGANAFLTVNFHYLDAELNGNTESKLVTGDVDINVTCSNGNTTPDEHGVSSMDLTNNFCGMANMPISYFIYVDCSHGWRTIFSMDESAVTTLTWTGATNTDWATSTNWTPSGVPDCDKRVIIPNTTTDPVLPASGTPQAKELIIQSGGVLDGSTNNLEICGGSGAWSNQGTFTAGTKKVTFTGLGATFDGTTSFYDVQINSGASLTLETGSIMRIGNTMTNSGTWYADVFNTTVEYNKSGAQDLSVIPNGSPAGYHNLILSGSGTKTMPSTALSVTGDFSMSGSATATALAAVNTTGNFTVGTGTSFTTGSYTHTIGGNFSNSGTFTATGSTINMNGTAAQSISGATTFNNLTVSNTSAAVSVNTNINVGGTLTMSGANTILTPGASVVINSGGAAGAITGDGKVQVTASGGYSSQYLFSTNTLTNLTVEYTTLTGSQTVSGSGLTYGTLTLDNTSGTNTAAAAITATTLNTTAGGTLNMGTYDLALTNVNNSGIIRTQSVSGTPLTAGLSWGGTVQYDAATGSQTVMAGTYTTLNNNNTSNTNTASGAISSTTLNTTAGGTLNMSTYTLGSTNVTNSGTIRTQNTSGAPLPSGISWDGTVNYDAPTGGQKVVGGTYAILTMGNTSGTQTAVGDLTVTTLNNNTNTADILDMGTYALTVTTPNNTGTISTQNTSGSPLTTGKTWGGTIQYNAVGAQTLMSGTYTNLTLAGSGAKTIENGGTPSVSGTLSLEGTATMASGSGVLSYGGSGTLKYAGSGASQTTSEAEFPATSGPANLVISNTSGVNYNLTRTLTGDFTLDAGAYFYINPDYSLFVEGTSTSNVANTAANLVIQSADHGTGCFCPTGTGFSATVQRYVYGSSSLGYHFLSSPIDGAALSTIQDPALGNYNVYWYDEEIVDSNLDIGWTRHFSNLINGRGYTGVYNASTTRQFAGSLNAGNINISATWTASTVGYRDPRGWNLLGNPYSCALNANTFRTVNGIGTVYLWNDQDGSITRAADYGTWNGVGGAASGSGLIPRGYIPVGQGFFVNVNPTQTINFTNAMRTSNIEEQFWLPDLDYVKRFRLDVTDNADNFNEILIAFSDKATNDEDLMYDSPKLKGNPHLALYSIMNNKDFVIQGFAPLTGALAIPVGLDAGRGGDYTFSVRTIENFDDFTNIYLEDKLTSKLIEMELNTQYTFNSFPGAIRDRFVLHFNPSGTNIVKELVVSENVNMYVQNGKIYISGEFDIDYPIIISDLLGKTILRFNPESNYAEVDLENFKGIFLVSMMTSNGQVTKKVFLH